MKKLESIVGIELVPTKNYVHDTRSALSVGQYFKEKAVDVICIKLATWSSDNHILDMSAFCDVPFIFWTYSHISAGSLCGGQQFNMVFKELKKQCILVHKDDENALSKIKIYSDCVALRNQLQKSRFCLIGNRTQGMAEVICDEFSVKEVFGPRIITIGLDEFKAMINSYSDEKALSKWQEVKSRVNKIMVSEKDGIRAIKNYFALKNYAEDQAINGFTIECYPNYMGEVCLGFSLLADEGIASACEGDVNSLLLSFILRYLSNHPVHDIDPLYLYENDNSLLGSHCGCGSFKLAESTSSIELANVRLAKKGLCVLFPSKTGTVTLANLVGRKGTYRMGVIEGEAIQTEMVFPGNPIRVKLPIVIDKFLDIIEENGLGHHWIIAYGNHGKSLESLSSLLKIDFIHF